MVVAAGSAFLSVTGHDTLAGAVIIALDVASSSCLRCLAIGLWYERTMAARRCPSSRSYRIITTEQNGIALAR